MDEIAGLIDIPTVSPQEQAAFPMLRAQFAGVADTIVAQPRHHELARSVEANANAYLARSVDDRANLIVRCSGVSGPHTLFSAHIDVVPAGDSFPEAFRARIDADAVIGRGAADTKGNVVMLAAALSYLRERGLPHRPVTLELVNEEEIGGNGAVSACLHGHDDVDEVVVMEPTSLEVFHGHRGAVEFTAYISGKDSHMGGHGHSAIGGAVELIAAAAQLEAELIREAKSDRNFHTYAKPVQINVGRIAGGQWRGSIPAECAVGLSFGFHPNYSIGDVRTLIEERLVGALPTPWFRTHTSIAYDGIHNDAYLGDPDSDVACALRAAAARAGVTVPQPRAWNVSCDARSYHLMNGIPTVIFGAGDLAVAHSDREFLSISEWERGVGILVDFLTDRSTCSRADL
ncbi:M20 family metallopeptidase [Nocardia uniformis]|uniref:M20 family metallopeptidase n=1 Tax=Nocardia uniformis TaxID=53432 RepID=UPI0014796A01|nr:M20/M25/M40 family metallo-hydrolase [Nocardia uniformis]